MDERRRLILDAAVSEYIRTGEPVSSAQLFASYDFGIRPAMIRAELAMLAEDGYLEQPHHSGGRVPTDLGYEQYAMSMLRSARAEAARRAARHHVMAKTWDLLAEDIAEKLGMLGVVGVQGDEVYKEGIARLVSSGAWDSHEAITEILEDFEGLDQRIPRAMENLEDDMPQVFIGRKSPVTRSDALAVLSQVLDVDGQRVSVFAIGPKRMDYASAIALFKKLFL